jgi:hypothetical protein
LFLVMHIFFMMFSSSWWRIACLWCASSCDTQQTHLFMVTTLLQTTWLSLLGDEHPRKPTFILASWWRIACLWCASSCDTHYKPTSSWWWPCFKPHDYHFLVMNIQENQCLFLLLDDECLRELMLPNDEHPRKPTATCHASS